MDDTVEKITQYSIASNMTMTIQTRTRSAPIRQVQAGTAASVASLVTVSAKKGSSTSSAHTPRSQSKTRSRFDTEANPVTPNLKTIVEGATVTHMDKLTVTEETQDTI